MCILRGPITNLLKNAKKKKKNPTLIKNVFTVH